MSQALSTDILIVGGGITGLWLNVRSCRVGYATVPAESASLGGGQSVESQGIIRGGAKYALHGALIGAPEAIADMPRCWRVCSGSDGEPDLRGVRPLSEAYYLWPPGGLAGGPISFSASKAARSRVEQVKGEDLSPTLRDKGFEGKAYCLMEIVFDTPDLTRRLAELASDSLLAGEYIEPPREGRKLAGPCVDGREIRAQRVVLSTDAGNEALLRELGLEQPAMQWRSLHMVMAKAAALKPLYTHCLGAGPKPRITMTTHPTRDGQPVWHLGGDIAEVDGVVHDKAAQIAEAHHGLAKLLPWINLGQAQWVILRVDRAEPAQSNLSCPDNTFLVEQGRLSAGWPTKLALASDFADRVCARLEEDGIRPSEHAALPQPPRPPLVEPAQEVAFA